MLDMHIHLTGHEDRLATAENIRLFLDQARKMGLKQIGFADHDYYFQNIDLYLIRRVAEEYPELKVSIGIEVDYRPEDEGKIKELLDQFPFDFVIGSVHDIKGWIFDIPEEKENYHRQDPDKMYQEYFAVVELAAASGLFTTIGHFDLIKLFGARPRQDILVLAEKALDSIQKNGLVMELNTAGRYKPVEEFYPENKIIQEIGRRGIPMTLGSDAHAVEHVGRDISEALQLVKDFGVKELVGFKQRQKEYYYLSAL